MQQFWNQSHNLKHLGHQKVQRQSQNNVDMSNISQIVKKVQQKLEKRNSQQNENFNQVNSIQKINEINEQKQILLNPEEDITQRSLHEQILYFKQNSDDYEPILDPIKKSIITCKPDDFLEKAYEIKEEQNKSVIVIDTTQQQIIYKFLKYKGSIIDFSEYLVQEKMKNSDVQDLIEKSRKKIVNALKLGHVYSMCFNQELVNLRHVFFNRLFWKPQLLFNPEKVVEEAYYKQYLLKPEEDVDAFGYPGCFHASNDFLFSILIEKDFSNNLNELFNKLGLDPQFFEILKIEQ